MFLQVSGQVAECPEMDKNRPLYYKILLRPFPIIVEIGEFVAEPKQNMLVIVGDDSPISYLIRRYAERLGCTIEVQPATIEAAALCNSRPLAVIFPLVETLEACQPLAGGLANCDIPIIVFSSASDQLHTRQLGADYCLLHPLGYDNFSETLTIIASLRGEAGRGVP